MILLDAFTLNVALNYNDYSAYTILKSFIASLTSILDVSHLSTFWRRNNCFNTGNQFDNNFCRGLLPRTFFFLILTDKIQKSIQRLLQKTQKQIPYLSIHAKT